MVTQYFFFLAWKRSICKRTFIDNQKKKKCSFTEELSPLILAQIFEDMWMSKMTWGSANSKYMEDLLSIESFILQISKNYVNIH